MKINDWLNRAKWKNLSDSKLMELVARDERVAFAILFNRHKEALFNYSLSILKNRAKAEEVTQEIFLKLYEMRHEYKEMGKLRSFLFRLVRNKSFDILKKKSEVLLGEEEEFSSHEDETFEKTLNKMRIEVLDKYYFELKSIDREILLLWVKGEAIRTIAEIIESSEGAVKTRLHRIKKEMTSKMLKGGQYEKEN